MTRDPEVAEAWTRIEPVAGLSSHIYFVGAMSCVYGASALAVIYTLVQFVTRAGFSQVIPNVMIATVFALLPIGYVLVQLLRQRTAKERSAGYTTSVMGWTDLPQIHRGTGLIIRPAGHPLLNVEEKRVQTERVNEYKRLSAAPHKFPENL